MKIYMKLFSLIFIGITGLISVSGILQIRRETTLFREEIRHDANLLGNVLANEISDAWKNGGIRRSMDYPQSSCTHGIAMNVEVRIINRIVLVRSRSNVTVG